MKEKAKTDQHYGPKAQEAIEPIDEEDLKKACLSKLKEFNLTKEEIATIEESTIGQHENDLYCMYRCDRLTASQFGMVGFTVALPDSATQFCFVNYFQNCRPSFLLFLV